MAFATHFTAVTAVLTLVSAFLPLCFILSAKGKAACILQVEEENTRLSTRRHMQAKSKTCIFTQLWIQEVFGQGSTRKPELVWCSFSQHSTSGTFIRFS